MSFFNRLSPQLKSSLPVASIIGAILALSIQISFSFPAVPAVAPPPLRPLVIVLIALFLLLALAGIVYLLAYWKGLPNEQAKRQFLESCAYGFFLFVLMIGGMFAKYFWELFQNGKGLGDANLKMLLLPLLISLMVFYPLWSMVSGAPKNFFAIVAAFQNGFFWQTVFSGLGPVPGKPPV